MTLYELALTPSARRVNIFLVEKGITNLKRVKLNVRAGDNLTPEFKAKSINGRIPLLELDDGTTLCESVAICRYLEETQSHGPSLFGNSPLARAQVEMWQRVVELQGLQNGFQAFRNITAIYSDRETCVEAWGHESKKRASEFLPILEHQLASHDFVAGDEFSIADISAYVFITFIKNLDIHLDANHTHTQAWFDRMASRPSVISVDNPQ